MIAIQAHEHKAFDSVVAQAVGKNKDVWQNAVDQLGFASELQLRVHGSGYPCLKQHAIYASWWTRRHLTLAAQADFDW